MYPPPRPKREYEKVPVEVWVNGKISEVQYKNDHENFNKEKVMGVRLKLELEGCKFPHYTRWMTFSYADKANLYKLVILPLIEGAKPDIKFDMDALKDLLIKTMWSTNEEYQNLDMIRPLGAKVACESEPPEPAEAATSNQHDDVPF